MTATVMLEGGFSNPAHDASFAFRAIMDAMARPGQIETVNALVSPDPLSAAAASVLLTLCDPETPVFLAPSRDTKSLREWITFHTGAPFVPAAEAMFAVGTWDELPREEFSIGDPAYPDRSATLIVEMDQLCSEGAVLTGPGIKTETQFSLPEKVAFQLNAQLFPQGLDFIFTAGTQIAALPRSTKVA